MNFSWPTLWQGLILLLVGTLLGAIKNLFTKISELDKNQALLTASNERLDATAKELTAKIDKAMIDQAHAGGWQEGYSERRSAKTP